MNEEERCPNCEPVVEPGTKESSKPDKWVIVTTVANDIEYEITADILQMGEIPCYRKVVGGDEFLQTILGTTLAGVDVYVPPDKLQEATELLEATLIDEDELAEQAEQAELADQSELDGQLDDSESLEDNSSEEKIDDN